MTFLEFLNQYVSKLKEKLGDNYSDDLIDIPALEKAYNEDIAGLKNKNNELLGKLKDTKSEFELKYKDIDIDEYQRLKEEAETR